MADDYIQARRLGYKVPRSILLPPYLATNPYFTELMEAVDEVFGPWVDDKINILSNIRNMWQTNPAVEELVQSQELIPFEKWPQPERAILSKQTNLLGMNFQNAGVLTNDAYQQITRNVGRYWFEKGTQAFIEFINYCLKADLTVNTLWAEIDEQSDEYGLMVPIESAGTPVWEGGTWSPTTHVQIRANGGLRDLDLVTLNAFFYEIANYNLVLYSIDASYDMWVVDELDNEALTAKIVAVGLFGVNAIVMSTFYRFGADAPPLQSVDPSIPTEYNAMGIPADFDTAFLLADPSAWIADTEGRKFAVFSEPDRVITEDESLPTQLMGEPSDVNQYTLLYGPVDWLPVPGSSRSKARIPVYSTDLPTPTAVETISARMIGHTRSNILVNPKGFTEIAPGKFTPYW